MSFIYKTTNLITGKIYIGQHSKNLNNYLGSGVKLLNSINVHGRENFEREILHDNITSQKALDALEKHYIKKYDSCNPAIGYNILAGSANGFGNCNPMDNPETRKRVSLILKGVMAGSNNPFYNKHHSEETKATQSEIMKGKFSGDKNPRFGKCGDLNPNFGKRGEETSMYGKLRINNGIENSLIDKNEDIPEGWSKGMLVIGSMTGRTKERHPMYGRICYNNGFSNKLLKITDDIPEGYVKGMIKKI